MQRSNQGIGPSMKRSGMGLALSLILGAGMSSAGGLYTFTDAQGTIHFTDRPQDVRYRLKTLPRGGLALGSQVQVTRRELDKIIRRVSSDHKVDPALVKAVIAAESNFEAGAVSRAGAVGLMQLMPSTAADMGVEAPFEPQQNVRGGVRYLKLLLDRFDALEHALAAYNAGPETVARYDGIPPYPETRAYVARVLRFYSRYQSVELLAKRETGGL
ncbi:MAG: lytic transglycosylase [Spirochaeta sp.]|nr:lytic transglycosylase [Spirochaeta sp.]RPG05753.1 MAG: DUF4124 domain-containing protein [Proteobacteria bacterium TMED72]